MDLGVRWSWGSDGVGGRWVEDEMELRVDGVEG